MFQIMVVEDDINARRLMQAVIEQNGYAAIPASDGAEALALMDKKHVDLIVLDVMMPHMDGYTLARELRSAGNNVPILMVTARQSAKDKKEGFLAGTDDYMVKPVDEEEMMLRIAALLRRSRIVSERRLTIGSSTQAIPCLTMMRLQLPAAASRTSFPTRNLCCCISFYPTQTIYLPADSLWTKYGTWRATRTSARLTCT